MLDPRFRGARITADQEESAENWLTEIHPEWVTSVMSFRIADSDYFPATMFSDAVVQQFSPKNGGK